MITLKTLAQATAQEVFNQAYIHLLTQNAQSKNSDRETCQYRNNNGLKCAVGCFIADDEYDERMENKGWRPLLANYTGTLINPNFNLGEAHVELLVRLQGIHDGYTPDTWKTHLEILATEENFTCPELPK